MVSTDSKRASAPPIPWIKGFLIMGAAVMTLLLLVLLAKWLRSQPDVQVFLETFPGSTDLPASAPVGMPAWLGWQHFLNAFFMVLIVRTGWLVRTKQRPEGYWTRNNTGLIRTKGRPTKISLDLWLHQSLDVLWMVNGIIFSALLLATGQWMRIVPISLDIVPNALSALLQYASLEWPHENGWVNYNSLQVLAYFATVFIAAPLAALTGVRMSAVWPKTAVKLNRIYPIEVARAIHFPVMLYFVLFIIVHITLVLTTGALKNLNHMYAASEDAGWLGFWFFAASLVVMIAAWLLARPLFLRPIASTMGKVTKN